MPHLLLSKETEGVGKKKNPQKLHSVSGLNIHMASVACLGVPGSFWGGEGGSRWSLCGGGGPIRGAEGRDGTGGRGPQTHLSGSVTGEGRSAVSGSLFPSSLGCSAASYVPPHPSPPGPIPPAPTPPPPQYTSTLQSKFGPYKNIMSSSPPKGLFYIEISFGSHSLSPLPLLQYRPGPHSPAPHTVSLPSVPGSSVQRGHSWLGPTGGGGCGG